MVFDVGQHKLVCAYCDTVCTVQEYRQNNAAEYVDDNYSVSAFRCKNCGAELTAPEEQTVAYCSYCGGEAMLTEKESSRRFSSSVISFGTSMFLMWTRAPASSKASMALSGR